MTAEEKAIDLVKRFHEGGYTPIQCAKICVDEIIKDHIMSLDVSKELHPHAQGLIAGCIVGWNEVKLILEEK